MPTKLLAGAAAVDITPPESCFLWGYPHVARYSTGVHDPLLASALYVIVGRTAVVFVGTDVLPDLQGGGGPRSGANRCDDGRTRGPGHGHCHTTHSGPVTAKWLSSDPVVPDPDPRFVKRMEDGIVAAAEMACATARPAQLGLAVADGSAVGGNRRDPAGPSNPRVPALVVCAADDGAAIAAMFICNMHPTVLHEDSTRISGDFPP